MAWHGWLGALVLLVAQALLPWQIDLLARWYTPVMWTGYILLVDAWVLRRNGRSLLHDRPREALFMATVSIPLWLVFEGYNARLHNWAYFGVPESPWVAAVAYAWAFATIWPGLFETAALLGAEPLPTPAASRIRVPLSAGLRLAMAVGGVFLVVPPLLPAAVRPWTFGFVWLGFILLLDPLNARAGRPSFLGTWRAGDRAFTGQWLLAGLVCGVLWEFWNYWALARWRYVGVPVFPSVKLFEMPLAGYLGFPPFALEVFAMYHFVRPVAGPPEPEAGCSVVYPPKRRGGREDRGEEGSEGFGDKEGIEQTSEGGAATRRQAREEADGQGEGEGDRALEASRRGGAAGAPAGRPDPRGPCRAPARRDPVEQAHSSGPLDLRGEGPRVGGTGPGPRGADRRQGRHPGDPTPAGGAGR